MTHRMTISLPDDVAARINAEPNASAFIARAVRHLIRGEGLDAMIADDGFVVTAEGRARMREKLNAARAAMGRPDAVAARQRFRAYLDAARTGDREAATTHGAEFGLR
jgi:hypothetical protein